MTGKEILENKNLVIEFCKIFGADIEFTRINDSDTEVMYNKNQGDVYSITDLEHFTFLFIEKEKIDLYYTTRTPTGYMEMDNYKHRWIVTKEHKGWSKDNDGPIKVEDQSLLIAIMQLALRVEMYKANMK